jgi:capsular polysaccharide biosynthesis protein/Mrp family chromosome partitioning ATPase
MIVAVTLVGVVLAAVYVLTRPASYVASARVLVQPNDPSERLDPDVPAPNIPSPDADRIVANQIQIIESDRIALLASRRLALDDIHMSAAQVRDARSATQTGATNVIRVSARTHDSLSAPAVANAVTNAYIDDRRQAAIAGLTKTVNQLETYGDVGNALNALNLAPSQVAALRARLLIDITLQRGGADVVDPARSPAGSARPSAAKLGVLGGLVGLLSALGLAFLFDQFDDRVHAPDDFERLVGAPILAMVPLGREPGTAQPSLPLAEEPYGTPADALRRLRTALQLSHPEVARRVLVMGASEHDAHSIVAASLAFAHGQAGARTVLVEGDASSGVLRGLVGRVIDPTLNLGQGLGHVIESMSGAVPTSAPATADDQVGVRAEHTVVPNAVDIELRRELAACLVRTTFPKVFFLPLGKSSAAPTDVLAMAGTTRAFTSLKTLFDVVVIDGPGAELGNESAALAQQADVIVLVAVQDATTERVLARWMTSLGARRSQVAGVVLCSEARRGRFGRNRTG